MSEGGKMFIEQILRNRRLATRKIWPRPDAMFNSRKSLGAVAEGTNLAWDVGVRRKQIGEILSEARNAR
jgi:hypothetical protein